MEYGFDNLLCTLEQLVAGRGSVTRAAPLFGAKADSCIYVFLPANPELQAILKKQARTYVFREHLLNRRNVSFIVAECYRCDDFGCTGHYDNPVDESGHCFRSIFPEGINGAYIMFSEERHAERI